MSDNPLEAAIQHLKQSGVRMTPQRKFILEYLITHHNHPTVETIYAGVDNKLPNLSLATVYNTLKLLVENDLVIELPATENDTSLHYDYFGVPHFHAICENCGKITDIFVDEYKNINQNLINLTKQQSGYWVNNSQFEVYGYCSECQKKLQLNNN